MPAPHITTPRLVLRPWRPSDLPVFAALNADPAVMEHFPAPLTRAQSDALAARFHDHFSRLGFGFWALEIPGQAAFIGCVGLMTLPFEAPFTPRVEIGWRLLAEQWGKGYATEAAQAVLDFAFTRLGLDEVVALTVPANHRSRQVMVRIGMTHSVDDDFEHPLLPPGHPLRPHVLYRIRAGRSPP